MSATDSPQVSRIVIADDDPLVRSGLKLLLGGSPEFDVIAEAADGREAIDVHATLRADLLLMDLRMPVLDGIAATAELKRLPHPPAVIVLTTFDADEYVVRALGAGADGFLLKDTPPGDIVTAMRNVLSGQPALSPSVTAALIKQVVESGDDGRSDRAASAVRGLTGRERDVARSLAKGASNAEIAAELYMSVATVKAHISHIFSKLGAANRVQVAIIMHDAGTG
ncbi:response regulator [Gordonia zhaorongruii]|uniref:response regulator n=1 Tax=Gordonia zhaorongruii TaxID=2597659 RepID=UPI0039A0B824